jgi:hypothetical protein
MAAFEDAVLTHGAELRTVRDEVGTRTIYEVVRYYGHWKKYVAVPFLSLLLSDFEQPKQYETRGRESEAASSWHVENTATVRTQHALR